MIKSTRKVSQIKLDPFCVCSLLPDGWLLGIRRMSIDQRVNKLQNNLCSALTHEQNVKNNSSVNPVGVERLQRNEEETNSNDNETKFDPYNLHTEWIYKETEREREKERESIGRSRNAERSTSCAAYWASWMLVCMAVLCSLFVLFRFFSSVAPICWLLLRFSVARIDVEIPDDVARTLSSCATSDLQQKTQRRLTKLEAISRNCDSHQISLFDKWKMPLENSNRSINSKPYNVAQCIVHTELAACRRLHLATSAIDADTNNKKRMNGVRVAFCVLAINSNFLLAFVRLTCPFGHVWLIIAVRVTQWNSICRLTKKICAFRGHNLFGFFFHLLSCCNPYRLTRTFQYHFLLGTIRMAGRVETKSEHVHNFLFFLHFRVSFAILGEKMRRTVYVQRMNSSGSNRRWSSTVWTFIFWSGTKLKVSNSKSWTHWNRFRRAYCFHRVSVKLNSQFSTTNRRLDVICLNFNDFVVNFKTICADKSRYGHSVDTPELVPKNQSKAKEKRKRLKIEGNK